MDGDDRDTVARAIMDAARQAEPDISESIRGLALLTAGSLERFGTRFKSRDSVLEKLERFRKDETPFYRLGRFNDALRYTVTYGPVVYWSSLQRLSRKVERVGYKVVGGTRGWFDTGYKGVNLTVRSPHDFDFEVQIHTPASLAMAERTHPMYEEARKLPVGDRRRAQLDADANQLWALVPVPLGVRMVPRW